MTSRVARLWQPGDPQRRLFLPDLWIAVLRSPSHGPGRLPKNVVKFECHPAMSKHDIFECLTKAYQLPVRDVRTVVKMGEIEWQNKFDPRNRRALWKEEDRKIVYAYMEKDFVFDFPALFDRDEEESELTKMKDQYDKLAQNTRFVNRNRKKIGELLS